MSAATSVQRATTADIPGMAASLARAFHDDPFYDWLLPKGPGRAPAALGFFRLLLRQLSNDLQQTYTLPDRAGCALWLPPGKHQLSWWRQARLIPSFTRVVGLEGIPRGLRIIAHMDALHERFAPEPHYTLSVLGVDPAAQGRGLSRLLLEPMLARCDDEKRLVYLETAKARNVPLYERYGFVSRAETKHQEFPTFWSMTRAPR